MALRFYDEALLNKIKSWVKDDKMTITSPDETRRLFMYRADVTNDKPIQLPLIALRRKSSFEILSTKKTPLTYDGMTLNVVENQSTKLLKGDQLNAIPIKLDYQIDIYTRYFSECDEYVRNFIFNIINYPKLHIEIPYNDASIIHDSNIRIESTVEDNSDIPERLTPGQFTRFTISINIDDAYLFSYKFVDNVTIDKINIETEF